MMNVVDQRDALELVYHQVRSIDEPLLVGMDQLFFASFPEEGSGGKSYFRPLISNYLDREGRDKGCLLAVSKECEVVGFVQAFFRVWRGGLVVWVDLLGVAEEVRRKGIGRELLTRVMSVGEKVAIAWRTNLEAIVALTEPENVACLRVFESIGAQIRKDLMYKGKLHILWIPVDESMTNVPTKNIVWLLGQFGGMLHILAEADCRF